MSDERPVWQAPGADSPSGPPRAEPGSDDRPGDRTSSGQGGAEPPVGDQPPARPRYGEFAPPGSQFAPTPPPPSAGYAPASPSGPTPNWAPPPTPGLVPLRPLGFGTLLSAPFRLLRHSRAILGLSIGLQLLMLLIGGGIAAFAVFAGIGRVTDFQDPDQQPLVAGGIAGIIVTAVVLALLNLVVAALLQGFVVVATARAVLGERVTLRELWRAVRPRLWPLIGWTAVIFVATLIGLALVVGIAVSGAAVSPAGLAVSIPIAIVLFLGLVVLYVWISVKLSLLPSALVLEQLPLRAALARSWRLTEGYFWRTFGVQALITVIISVASNIISAPVSFIPLLGLVLDPNGTGAVSIALSVISIVLSGVLSVVIASVTSVVLSGAISLMYLDLRMRKEGLDLVLQRHVEDRSGDDPFAPGAV